VLNKVYFWTATINQWQRLLKDDEFKEVILESLNHLCLKDMMKVYALVVMPNHIHLVIECLVMNGKEMPHASFLKYTAHIFRKMLLLRDPFELEKYAVKRNNKNYEFWQKDSYAFELTKLKTAWQKINYIHNNPLQEHWKLCEYIEDYKFSSAKFYLKNDETFNFLERI
jgi:REP element-mobilizing transposase RayT